MRPFRLGTTLRVLAAIGTAIAAFGVWGIPVALICALLMTTPLIGRMKPHTPIALATIVLAGMVIIDFSRLFYLTAICDGRPWDPCTLGNLELIGQALQRYHAAYGCLPPAHVNNKKGEPIHSWRALILPYLSYLGDGDIYHKYDLDEPWNSRSNRGLADERRAFFRCPLDNTGSGFETSYVAVVGPGTAWEGDHGHSLKEIIDDPSQTVLVVEVLNSGVHWMKPCDITLDQALKGVNGNASVPSSRHIVPGGYFYRGATLAGGMLMADGTVVTVPVQPSSKDMAALLSINGHDRVDIHKLQVARLPESRFRWDHIIGLPLFLAATTWRCRSDRSQEKGNGGRPQLFLQQDSCS
jgi:hypothetical protein